jgi:Uma2 family endonuclease
MAVALQRRLFTADEFERMAEAGIFDEDERLELLEGEIVAMSPIGSPHAWCLKRLVRLFARLGERVILSVQDPVRLDERSTPQPDLALLRPDTSQQRHPGPPDILLVVEVASSSVAEDREIKGPLYARAGVAEFWLADLIADRLEVYRDPAPTGYRLVWVFGRGQRVSPLFAPDFMIDVDAILGPADGAR